MAYMIVELGPFPNKAGEYCGNYYPPEPHIHMEGERPEDWAAYLRTVRFGQPHASEAGTTEERLAAGRVGLYLKKDSTGKLEPERREIPTPPELMEPD